MLKIQNLYGGYGNKYVIKNINVEIEQNIFVGIIGKNGSGKSTLIKGIAGILPYLTGEILFNQTSLRGKNGKKIISYVPQESSIIFGFSVSEILKMSQNSYTTFFGRINEEEQKRLLWITELFELKGLLDRSILTLSGGERKKVMIARGVAQMSDIILLDEPLSGLDIEHQVSVSRILKDISKNGRIVVASIHDLNIAAQFCDKILLLENGEMVKYGTVEEVLTYNIIKNTFGVDVYVGVNEINNKRFLVPFK
ncbi:MAG: ABC transporter ATP-binding protein [Myxococcota bacterium]